jgi:DNA-binding response OmpR family regulator
MKRILVAEDDKKISAALDIRLTAAGYEVWIASDGSKGLKLAIQGRPDLILMDIWMPNEMGFAVAERLKREGLSRIPIIFITASKKAEFWKMAQEVGAVGFFEKPFDVKKLLTAIALVLK